MKRCITISSHFDPEHIDLVVDQAQLMEMKWAVKELIPRLGRLHEIVLSGKTYNKAMIAPKLTLQALWCPLLPMTFILFAVESDQEFHNSVLAMAADI